MKIGILYETSDDLEEYPGANLEDTAVRKKRKRPKLDREEVFQALTKLDHEPSYLELDGRDATLFALARAKVDLIFNLAESYGGDDTKDLNVPAFLDLIGTKYTGSGPHGLLLAQDKALAKKIIGFHGIQTPFSAVSHRGLVDYAHDVKFPLIVKPVSEDGSIGIDVDSVVNSVKELMERIHKMHEDFDTPILIEEYIEGREIYAAILGNDLPEALPLVELDLSKLPADTPKIAGREVKFERDSEVYKLTKSALAKDIDDEMVTRLQEAAKTTFRALKLRDYGRIDMRLAKDGAIYVIEANPNPWLSSQAEFAMAARGSGRTYTEMIGAIVEVAMKRYGS
ncbi:MAG TPA: ATP-grasp domain-containing protein [Thermoanaerobaculia bacterium]|nr:ATP-grasp domain-containing protein [Thermoanaerobaculia bacterium]